jgi:ATP phosphoribosyltransferase regulatory subunit HisZ
VPVVATGEFSETVPVPTGTRDVLPGELELERQISASVLEVFANAGFREVATPALEFLETMRLGDPRAAERAYAVTDNDGRMLVARFDSTIPIARMAATTLAATEPPLRLCYLQNVLRPIEPKRGQSREFLQVGMELLGLDAPEGDAEAITLACNVLEAAGIRDYRIAVGDSSLFGRLLDDAGITVGDTTAASRDQIMYELETRDMVGLERELAASGLDENVCASLTGLAQSRGGSETLTADGVDNLRELALSLNNAGVGDRVIYDLGLIRSQTYYTGTVIEVYASGHGAPLGGGGRYDELIGRFGRDLSAFGFALNMDEICRAREAQESRA